MQVEIKSNHTIKNIETLIPGAFFRFASMSGSDLVCMVVRVYSHWLHDQDEKFIAYVIMSPSAAANFCHVGKITNFTTKVVELKQVGPAVFEEI